MNVSIASIPPRIINKTIYKFIDSILNQTIEIKTIYINLPYTFKRFDPLTEQQKFNLLNYNKKIKLTYTDYDSPALKYIGALRFLEDDEYIFIGDDDQEYHHDLLRRMKEGCYKEAVFQNRYHQVKKGTAGIIHGFTGLMLQKKVFKNLNDFNFPSECWIDDQLFNIYFFLNNIEILPSPIHDFDEIYETLERGMERIGEGALCMMPISRLKQIRELEKLYGVFFLKKGKPDSKGQLKKVDWNIKDITINFCILDKTNDSIKNNCKNLITLYPDFSYNFYTQKDLYKDNPEFEIYTDNYLKYETDKYAFEKIKGKEGHIYINRNMKIDKNFDIYEYLLNEETIFYNNENILLVKSTHKKNL
jgi:hypothetical protein